MSIKNGSNIDRLQLALRCHCRFVVVDELLELLLVGVVQLREAEIPFIDVH